MNFWTGVHFLSFVVYAFAVFYVIIKNPYAVTNWVLAILFFYFALWSACSCVLDNTDVSLSTANLVMKIQSIGWVSFTSYYVLFILFLTNNKKLLSSPLVYLVILLIPGIFIYQNYIGNVLVCCQKVPYGMAGTWAKSIWAYAYIFYYSFMFFGGTFLLFKYRNGTRINSERQMADILLISATAVFLIGTVFTVFMNYMHIYNPVDANVTFLIFVGGFIYSAEKYEAFTLSSTRNADRIMDLINEGIVLIDRAGALTTANRAALDLFGYTLGYDIKNAYEFIEKNIKNAGVDPDGAEVTNSELTFKDAAGDAKTVLVSSRALLKGKDHSGRVCTIRDITTKKKAEVDLMETVKELKRSNEDLESFAYLASHDLREPLRMVTSYVQLIKKKLSDKLDKDGVDFINYATEGAARMSELIEGLLEYSRIRRNAREASFVNTALVVSHAIEIMKFRIQDKKAAVTVKGILPSIRADRMQIEQLFQNLLANALKFTGNETAVIEISAEKPGNYYEFTIKDNGIGIEKQYLEKVFQLFQRLNPRDVYEGTGVGLAICKKIVEAHGGKIWVESDGPGKGCGFMFTLPAFTEE